LRVASVHAGSGRHAAELAGWLRAVLGGYPDRVLSLDAEAALQARTLARKTREARIVAGFADLTVACIARAHGLVVATRNLRDFVPLGIDTVDPFAA
jgi:predicted nucleic acid-binding protein